MRRRPSEGGFGVVAARGRARGNPAPVGDVVVVLSAVAGEGSG